MCDHFYGTHAHACTHTRLFPFGLWTVKWHMGPSSKKCPLSQALPGLPDHRCIPRSGRRGHFPLGPASAEGLSQAGHHILGHGWFVHSISKSALKAGLFAHLLIRSFLRSGAWLSSRHWGTTGDSQPRSLGSPRTVPGTAQVDAGG